jgi:hypothetical protein
MVEFEKDTETFNMWLLIIWYLNLGMALIFLPAYLSLNNMLNIFTIIICVIYAIVSFFTLMNVRLNIIM